MPGQRLPATLKKRSDFLRVQGGGKRFKRTHMVLLVAPTPDCDELNPNESPRVGYTLSRKVGNAVVRNRVRRRFREIVRHHATELLVGYDYVVIAFPSCADASFDTLGEELTWLLRQAKSWASAQAPSSS